MIIDKNSRWYKNCVRRRKEKAKICDSCPFLSYITEWGAEIKRYEDQIYELRKDINSLESENFDLLEEVKTLS